MADPRLRLTRAMLRRFSLYGFLKNQRYFEPFLVLAFLDKGMTYFTIGLLIGWRELLVNLFEIPSGAMADLFGRRRAMLSSFVAYIISFTLFGLTTGVVPLFVAMAFYALGDAFRTGTHKAMIFRWLRDEGRAEERTAVYGYTRSWSKLGSALSVVVGALVVLLTGSYALVFLLAIPPYVLGIINFLGYPESLDGDGKPGVLGTGRLGLGDVHRLLWATLRRAFSDGRLRSLILESMGFEGLFKAAKDYLQPILRDAAAPLAAALIVTSTLDEPQRAALLIGPVYFVLFLLSAGASRGAHLVVQRAGGEEAAARTLWAVDLALFALLTMGMLLQLAPVLILAFVLLHVVQNVWRPILVGRVDAVADEASKATVLSVESQSKTVATLIAAPVLGFAVDLVNRGGTGDETFWPVGVLGLIVGAGFVWMGARRRRRGYALDE